jgi:nucleosome binding factor SPN SPT16 subunit
MGSDTSPPWERRRSVGQVVQWADPSDIHAQDILFSNVKHLFFQPCDHELLVILHVHLKAPIMIGKKKTYV